MVAAAAATGVWLTSDRRLVRDWGTWGELITLAGGSGQATAFGRRGGGIRVRLRLRGQSLREGAAVVGALAIGLMSAAKLATVIAPEMRIFSVTHFRVR